MERLDLGMALFGGQGLRVGDCFLAFDREFFEVECHDGPLSLGRGQLDVGDGNFNAPICPVAQGQP